MAQINCYIPIKLRLNGELGPDQLDQLGATLARTVAARLAQAKGTIAASQGWTISPTGETIREEVDFSRLDFSSGGSHYHLPSYDGGETATAVPIATRQAMQSTPQPSLVYFQDDESILEYIRSFYSNPLPRGNTYYGVYGIWANTNTPAIFWITGRISEGPQAGGYLLDSLPLVSGRFEGGRFVPSGTGDVPIQFTLGTRYRLVVLLDPRIRRGVHYHATFSPESGGRETPIFLTGKAFAPHRGKVIQFGVPSGLLYETVVRAARPAQPTAPASSREAPWAWFWGASSLPSESEEGISPELWYWYGWLNVRQTDVRTNRLVQAIFNDWQRRGERAQVNLLIINYHYVLFYKEFCQRLALDMLATSQKNMTDFLGALNRDQIGWVRRFSALIQALRQPASQLHAITSLRTDLQRRMNILNTTPLDPEDPFTRVHVYEEISEIKKSLNQLQVTKGHEEKRLSEIFQMIQSLEPILSLLTLQKGQTVRTLEGGLVWAATRTPEQLLQHVQHEVQWLIRKGNQAAQEIRTDVDAAYKLIFVQDVANTQLASWLKANRSFREAVERLIKGPGLLEWIGLTIGLLILTFTFPPGGIAAGVGIGVGIATHSVLNAMQLSRVSGARLAQYEFAPLVTEAEVNAAIGQATIDVLFALIDVGVAAAAASRPLRGFVLARRLNRETARAAAGALGRSLEQLLLGWRRLDRWPPELVQTLRRQVLEQLDQALPAWRSGLSLEQSTRYVDELLEIIQRQLVAGYERRLLEFQRRFHRALEAGDVGDIQAWLTRELPEGESYFRQQIREGLAPGKSLYDDTLARRLAGQAPLPAPQIVAFLGKTTQAELEALARDLGRMANLLTANRLYALGRSAEMGYTTLARRLKAILGRVEQPERVLGQLENLLVGHPAARAFLTALESVPNPRHILSLLTPEALSAHLIGGVHELIQAAGRSSRRGQVMRLISDLDEQGVQRLFREVRRPDGRSFFQRWDGISDGWQYEGRIRAAPPERRPLTVVCEAERVAALSRLESKAAARTAAGRPTAAASRIQLVLDAIRAHRSGQQILTEFASLAVREGGEVANRVIRGLTLLENGPQGAELQTVADFLRRGGEGRALAAILDRGPSWAMRVHQRPFLALLPSLQLEDLRGISLILSNRGFAAEGAEAVLAITVRNFADPKPILRALGEVAPHSEGLSRLVGYLANLSQNLNQAALGQLFAARRLLEEFPGHWLIFEVPVSRGGRVIREIDVRVVTPYTRVSLLDVELKEVTHLFTFTTEHVRRQFARDIVRSVQAARTGEAPLARIRWLVRERELLQRGLTRTQIRDQIRDHLRQAFNHSELNALTQAQQAAALRDFEENLERIVHLF